MVRNERGFSLIELAIAVVMVGIMSMALAPIFSWMTATRNQLYDKEQSQYQRSIVAAMINYAAYYTTDGTLPAPYTNAGDDLHYSVADLTPDNADETAILNYLYQEGLETQTIFSDGSAGHRVRVFQRVTGLTNSVPLYLHSGPLVTLTYDYGALYLTACAFDEVCNAGLPGDSVALTNLNFSTWATAGLDKKADLFSTLNLQMKKLKQTGENLIAIRSKLEEFVALSSLSAAAGDMTNWFPAPTGGAAVDLSGSNPVTNQGCHDGWYDLTQTVTTNILAQMGLSATEYANTAWGGSIEYCRDYEPLATGVGSADTPPHYAALRVNEDMSKGISPDNAVIGNNVFITF